MMKTSNPEHPFVCAATIVTVLLLSSSIAHAHTEGVIDGGGLFLGFLHPIKGIDHILAMLAVGMWGAQLGKPALWALPVAFPLVMAMGGVLGIVGIPLPGIEIGIALSVVVLGTMIALCVKVPLWGAGIIVGFFAIFHGHAHGAELPDAAGALPYSLGFVVATGLIHLIGIGFGMIKEVPKGEMLLRGFGAAFAIAGVYLLVGHLTGA